MRRFRTPFSAVRTHSLRSFSIFLLQYHPNHAVSHVPSIPAFTAGVLTSDDVAAVLNRFQPPCKGGSFLARRAVSVPQSIVCRSTLTPICDNNSRVTRVAAWRKG